jgi:hypothetical protein
MTFQEWKTLTAQEQSDYVQNWSPYDTEEIQPLLDEIIGAFRTEYPDLRVPGYGNVHGSLMLAVDRPFIFDKRKFPVGFMGIPIRYSLTGPLPDGFKIFTGYVWAPENYLAFVDSHTEEIRLKLQDPAMSREEMLDALVGMPFDKWIEQCQKWRSTNMEPGDRALPMKPWWKIW